MRKEVIKLMKAIRILIRSLRDSFKSIVRNFSLSIAAILCVMITLILVSISLIAAANINYTTKIIEDELSIVVYVNKDTQEEELKNIEVEIKEISKVSTVKLKTKDEWKNEMIEYSDTFKTVLNYLEENPLLDSFIVKVKDVKDLTKVAEYIKAIDNVETVKYGESMVESIISVFAVVQKITIVIVIMLILITAFLINNTIKLTIFSRREEIEIMRLVGASNTTIKLPFIFEGFIIGLLGSIVPICMTIYGYIILYTHYDGALFNNMIVLLKPTEFIFSVAGILIIIGTIVGMFGSIKAVRRYLKI